MVCVGGGVEDALALGCGSEFRRRGFAGGALGLVGGGGVGELGGWCGCVGGERIGGGGALKGGVEDGDDVVDAAHAAAVAELLGRGEAPWDFPVVDVLAAGVL